MNNKSHYPPFIPLSEFSIKLNSMMIMHLNDDWLMQYFYQQCKTRLQKLTIIWIETYGYDIEDWAKEYFKDWQLDFNGTRLKAQYQ